MTKVCLIIVTFNRIDTLLKNLECVYKQKVMPNHIVVVDNFSDDETVIIIKKEYPEIELIQLHDNLGYAAGLAAGMQANLDKDFDCFWLMDDDSFPGPTFLKNQLANIDIDYGILGSIGAKLNYFNLKVVKQGGLKEVDFVLVDCAIVNIDVVRKIGLPNSSLFMMCEDLEYCKRIKKAGFKIYCLPTASVSRLHLGSQMNSDTLKWRAYYHSRNHIYILLNFFSFKHLTYVISMQSKFIVNLLFTFKFIKLKYRTIGLVHGIIGKNGKTLNPINLKFK